MKRIGTAAAAAVFAVSCLVATAARAVGTTNLEQTSASDFEAGTFVGVSVSSLGELKLARKLDVLLKDDKDVAFVNALAVDAHGVVYAATAPAGKLFRIVDGKAELYYTAKEKTLQSLAVGPKGQLYVGTGGGEGKILEVTAKDTARVVLERKGLAYVWAIGVLDDGRLVAATGPAAELIAVAPADKPSEGEVLYKLDPKLNVKNLLSLAVAKRAVYFGTDVEGLIFRYDLEAKRAFLFYDADQAEIASLVLAPNGKLYASTSDPRAGAAGANGHGQTQGRPAPGPASQPAPAGGDDDEESDEAAPPADEQPTDAPAPPAVPADASDDAPEGNVVIHDVFVVESAGPRAGSFARAADRLARRPLDAAPTTQPDARAPAAAAAPVASAKGRNAAPTTQPDKGPKGARPGPRNGQPTPEMIAQMRAAMQGRGRPGGGEGGGGNAVLQFDTEGFVTEILRQPTLMLGLLCTGDGHVIVATGGDGRVLDVTLATEEVATLAKPADVAQVLALAAAPDGTIYMGTANGAIVARIGHGVALSGSFTSAPIDAKMISRWGVVSAQLAAPAGTSVKVQTRSGNLAKPDDALWSAWSEPADCAGGAITIAAPPARFLQYRLVLATNHPARTAVVDSIALAYTNENQPPRLMAVKVLAPGMAGGGGDEDGPSNPQQAMMAAMRRAAGHGGGEEGGAAPGGAVMVLAKAADPNGDNLDYRFFFRKLGTESWVPLTDDPIREPKFRWATVGVPDGRYVVKVVVSDSPANPASTARTDARISDPFVIDNTPPTIANFRVLSRDGAKLTVAADATDALSRLASGQIKVDSASESEPVVTADGVWDQTGESLRAVVDLSDRQAGAHLLILTVTDAAGNSTSAALEVTKP